MSFNWNDPTYNTSQYHKWATEGDTIEGVVTGMTTVTFPAKEDQAEQTFPVLILDTAAGEKEVTISGVDLLPKTKAKNPQIGDWYSAAWVATAGKKRIFLVIVKKMDNEPARAAVPTTQQAIDAQATGMVNTEIPF